MNENKNITKPLTLLREEFVMNMAELCNNSGLPFFVVESVLKDFIQEVNIASKRQFEADKIKYSQELASLQLQSSNEDSD